MKTNLINLTLALATSMGIAFSAGAADPVFHWDFENIDGQTVTERVNGSSDTLEGNYTIVEGVRGKAIRLDGYTTVVSNKGGSASPSSGSVTTEAWIALEAYPWNWCPVVAQRHDVAGSQGFAGGFSMALSTRGRSITRL